MISFRRWDIVHMTPEEFEEFGKDILVVCWEHGLTQLGCLLVADELAGKDESLRTVFYRHVSRFNWDHQVGRKPASA